MIHSYVILLYFVCDASVILLNIKTAGSACLLHQKETNRNPFSFQLHNLFKTSNKRHESIIYTITKKIYIWKCVSLFSHFPITDHCTCTFHCAFDFKHKMSYCSLSFQHRACWGGMMVSPQRSSPGSSSAISNTWKKENLRLLVIKTSSVL